VNRIYPKILRNRKQRTERRLKPKNWEDQPQPMLRASNIHYEMGEQTPAMNYGGIGAIHLMAQRLGLVEDINGHLHLLKVHLPYHESDHVLNLAYNLLTGGQRLEDIQLRRQDEVFLNSLGAERIPDPTTAGDFTRRFSVEDIVVLEECINRARLAVWKVQPEGFLKEAFVDADGTIAQTFGECKELQFTPTSLGERPGNCCAVRLFLTAIASALRCPMSLAGFKSQHMSCPNGAASGLLAPVSEPPPKPGKSCQEIYLWRSETGTCDFRNCQNRHFSKLPLIQYGMMKFDFRH